MKYFYFFFFFFSSRRRHTRFDCDWSSDVCSSDLDSVVEAVQREAAGEVGQGAIEFANREIPMPAPAVKHRAVGRDGDAAREGLDGFAELPHSGLGNAERDDAVDISRIGVERSLGACDGSGIGHRLVFDAGGRAVLNGLSAGVMDQNS